MELIKTTRTHATYTQGGRIICEPIDPQALAVLQWHWWNTTANQ